jgi:hypothetical protein
VWGCCVFAWLSILDRLFGPEPTTPADLTREVDHDRLVRAFSAASVTFELPEYLAGQKMETVTSGLHSIDEKPAKSLKMLAAFAEEQPGRWEIVSGISKFCFRALIAFLSVGSLAS